ncbi:hypothetical protein [Streptomyces sp. NPDC054838]
MDLNTLDELRDHRDSTAQTLTVLRSGRGHGSPSFTAIEQDMLRLQESWALLWDFVNQPDKTPTPHPGDVDPRVVNWTRTQYDERVVSLRNIVIRRPNSNPDDEQYLRAKSGTLHAVRDLYRLVCFAEGRQGDGDGTPSWYTP